MMTACPSNMGGVDVSRETFDRLQTFESEVRRWNSTVNLVSRASLDVLWARHMEDSAQVYAHCPIAAEHWVDLGSGGGFPGLVVAILAAEHQPNLRVTLVESDQRKAVFLRQTSQKLGLSVILHAARIESLPPLEADVVSARALAPLGELLSLSRPHLRSEGLALFPKGVRFGEEVSEARKSWDFDLDVLPSLSQPDAALLIIRKFNRAKLS